ncbi:MAG TPA: PAS domain-containing sensor histidine kinase [Polyangium sp.]|nr:PAS domain-containing sensor histidine kinase [Polyangium sp.]
MRFSPLADSRLEILNLLDQPVWITDPDAVRIVWANRAAVALWRAEDVRELVNRDLAPSPTIRATLQQLRERVATGERFGSERTIYPKGEPVRVHMSFKAFPLPDGRGGLLVEATQIRDVLDPEVVRAAEAVRYAPLVVTTHARDGSLLQANTLARATFGNAFSFAGIFAEPSEGARVLAQVAGGEPFFEDVEVVTTEGPRWFSVAARPIPDAVTGKPGILVSAHDMTARIEAERAKDELVSVVSHELRTPLTAIRGAIGLVVGGVAGKDPALHAELLQMASENAQRLGQLVDDLLDVRKLAAGSISLKLANADLADVVRGAVELHAPAAQAKEIVVEADVPAGMSMFVDPQRIQQVVLNFLSNAIKHSPAGEVVRVHARGIAEGFRVEVADRGPGVPEAFRDKIFRRFSQADASSTRSIGGTGLGLYIAKTIVVMHGGRLGYENGTAGGTVFFFELPAKATD